MNPIFVLIAQRIALGLVTLWFVSFGVFFAIEALPGDTAEAILGQSATPEAVASLREELNLDRPALERYWDWQLGVLSGEFGQSLSNGRPVSGLISTRLGNTLFLAGGAALISVPLALGLGMLAALWRNSIFDRCINVVTLTSISLPEFFIGYLLIYLLAIKAGLMMPMSAISPSTGLAERITLTILPALTLTVVVVAHMMRMTRAALVNLLALPYVEMARLKGARDGRVIFFHVLPNALAPIVTVIALNLAYLITGVVVVEVVFVYPGLGQLLVDSVSSRDLPVVQASCMIFASVYILLNLTADVIAIVSDPKQLHPA
jgi:peptide/nickel transport system permease protein